MVTHSSVLAWKMPWTEEPGGLQSWDCKESEVTEHRWKTLPFFHSSLTPIRTPPPHTHKLALLNGEVCKEVLYYADKTQISQVQGSSAVSTFKTGTVNMS